MKWPEREDHAPRGDTPHLWLDPSGRLEVSPDVVTQADARFEAVCAELGILLARRVEPVSARVLPFGTEQLAMVELREAADGAEQIHTATARGASPGAAIAGAAINAVTGGRNVLAASLPGAVAEGKVRTAVVFADGEAPVRWGLSADEGRLAALYSVIPHLGSFTATTDEDTYRVLRLPGIGVALVSEGPSAAAWVEGWFAALLHATQFALRAAATPTDVVAAASAAPESAAAVDPGHAQVMHRLEEECRRILTAAQDQAREIREAALRDAGRSSTSGVAPSAPGSAPGHDADADADPWRRADAQESAREEVEPPAAPSGAAVAPPASREADELLVAAEQSRATLLAEAKREAETLLRETERARTTLLSDARREADGLLREAERARDKVLSDARRESDEILRDAERARTTLFADSKREAEGMLRETERARATLLADARREAEEMTREVERSRRDADRARREAESARDDAAAAVRGDADRQRRDAQRASDTVIGDARRVADDVIHEARRAADELVRDAAESRRRLLDEVHRPRGQLDADVVAARRPEPATHDVAPVVARAPQQASPGSIEPMQGAAAALLASAADAIAALSAVVARSPQRDEEGPASAPTVDVAVRGSTAAHTPTDDGGDSGEPSVVGRPLDDLPALFFGA